MSEDSDGIPAPKQRETSKKRRKSKNSTAAGSNLLPTSPPPGEAQDVQDQANEHNLLDQGQQIHGTEQFIYSLKNKMGYKVQPMTKFYSIYLKAWTVNIVMEPSRL